MYTSLLALPPELIHPIVCALDGGDLCSLRLTSRYLCKASDRAFVQHISRNQYFTLEDSLHKLAEIGKNVFFNSYVESLRFHPHSLTWNTSKLFPALAREEIDYTRWLIHPLTSEQRNKFQTRLVQQWQARHARADIDALSNALSSFPRLSRIEIGSWGPSLLEVERQSMNMRKFRNETGLGLLHFDWRTVAEARVRGTRASCDGDCSLTEDFKMVLDALSTTKTPLTEMKAHYWSDAGLKCVQICEVPMPDSIVASLVPSFSNLKVLHLCLGFETGRRSPHEPELLTKNKTWLSNLLKSMPLLEELKLVFDGWAQWEVRPDSDAPDWSGSIFHHLVNECSMFPRLRKLDLQNMFVRWLDVARFLELHRRTLVELSLNRINVWNVLSWTQSPPESDSASWMNRFNGLLNSMPSLRSLNISWFCVNGRMMCFHRNNFRHCSGCDDKAVSKPTDYGVETCPHYAFGKNRDIRHVRGSAARKLCGPNTSRPQDFKARSVVMIPMHIAFPLYYQADENDYEAQWQYYDGTVGRWETPGPDVDSLLESEGGYFG